jgi:hypothetical protein
VRLYEVPAEIEGEKGGGAAVRTDEEAITAFLEALRRSESEHLARLRRIDRNFYIMVRLVWVGFALSAGSVVWTFVRLAVK